MVTSTTTSQAPSIPQLRTRLSGRVIGPKDDSYDAARSVFPGGINRRPAVIVQPADASDVRYIVGLAADSGLALSVRSGGHSSAGHGVNDGGIVLDLATLRTLDIDTERGTAWAGAGLTTGDYTTAAAEHRVATGFGDTASVGVGGIALAGGIGYLVRKHGLTIDHLLAADVVTADGRLLRADEETNPDLFWAIRGGGGNFGVATKFLFRLHRLPSVVGGLLVLPATADTIEGFVAAADAAPIELSAIGNVMPAPPMPFLPPEQHGKLVILATLVYAGPVQAAERALAPFRALTQPLADLLQPMPYPQIYPPQDPDYHPLTTARTLFVNRIDQAAAQLILDRLRASTAPMAAAQLRVLGGAMADVPVDATAFAHRTQPIMMNLAAVYHEPDNQAVHQSWITDFAAALHPAHGAYVGFLGDEGPARVREAYPGPTWDRLAAIKGRYDPGNLFRLNQNIPPIDPSS